jgi:hypothetical protein
MFRNNEIVEYHIYGQGNASGRVFNFGFARGQTEGDTGAAY